MSVQSGDLWCGGPDPARRHIRAPDFGLGLAGKSFDAFAQVTVTIPIHAFNPGFNARSTMTMTGPTRYSFSVIARTRWDSASPRVRLDRAGGVGAGRGNIRGLDRGAY